MESTFNLDSDLKSSILDFNIVDQSFFYNKLENLNDNNIGMTDEDIDVSFNNILSDLNITQDQSFLLNNENSFESDLAIKNNNSLSNTKCLQSPGDFFRQRSGVLGNIEGKGNQRERKNNTPNSRQIRTPLYQHSNNHKTPKSKCKKSANDNKTLKDNFLDHKLSNIQENLTQNDCKFSKSIFPKPDIEKLKKLKNNFNLEKPCELQKQTCVWNSTVGNNSTTLNINFSKGMDSKDITAVQFSTSFKDVKCSTTDFNTFEVPHSSCDKSMDDQKNLSATRELSSLSSLNLSSKSYTQDFYRNNILNFGNTNVKEKKVLEVMICNPNKSTLYLTGWKSEKPFYIPQFSKFSKKWPTSFHENGLIQVNPKSYLLLPVVFLPKYKGKYMSFLEIEIYNGDEILMGLVGYVEG
ncbi:hypothetical protein HK099_003720 [Clydaea vesicula]|uniref:Uncharacterized protein n=1 Tax=Clydaea vesicula TaxID=447962 RepID=A0AAD5U1P1_9FUNG|nr:hypothetical protein HK099_003720 [Clydaea vesicula]